MGDDELTGPPAKKRGAVRQISKDDRSDSEEERFMPSESGSFQKASDEVIASRRIVKVRRSAPSQGPAAPNPFASICLVPSGPSPLAPDVALSCEPEEKKVVMKDQPLQSGAKDAEGHGANEEVKAVEESVEASDEGKNTHAGVSEELKRDVDEDNLEMAKRSVASDKYEETTSKNEGDICRTPANTLTTEKGVERGKSDYFQSEENNEKNTKSQVEDENKQSTEEKDSLTSTKGDAGEGQKLSSAGIGDVADDRGVNMGRTSTVNAGTTGSFSFDTTPFLSETPTAFALYSDSWAKFGSSTASGVNLATGFAFGLTGNEGAFTAASSPFSNSNGSSFQLFNSSQSISAPLSTGPPSQPPASAVHFQGGITPTGEEEERMVFGADATLFEFIDASWKERGKGELRINVPSVEAGKARLLMRSKGNFRLILNASLFADMKMTNMDSRGVTFACVNSAVEERVA